MISRCSRVILPSPGRPGTGGIARHQIQPAALILQIFAVLERQVEEQPPGRRHVAVEAAGERPVRGGQRKMVAGPDARGAAEDVARHLIEQHDQRQRAQGRVLPIGQGPGNGRVVIGGETGPHRLSNSGVLRNQICLW